MGHLLGGRESPDPRIFMLSRKLPRGRQLATCAGLIPSRLIHAWTVTLTHAMSCCMSDIERTARLVDLLS